MLQPVLVRPVAGGTYELIAGERRWRAAQLAGFEAVPGGRAAARRRGVARARADREHGPRGPQPGRGGARRARLLVEELGLTREEVGRRVGRSRVAVSNLLRLLDLPDEVLELLADGALTEGHGRALLMAPRPRRPPPPRARRRRGGLDGAPDGGAGPRGRRRAGPAPAPTRPRRRCTPTRSRPPSGSATRSAARSAPRSRCARAATATGSRSPSTRSTRRWRWPSGSGVARPRLTARRPRRRRYHRAAEGD